MLQPVPTKVVCLTQVVTADELKDDEEYEDILEDMRTEGGKFGKTFKLSVTIFIFCIRAPSPTFPLVKSFFVSPFCFLPRLLTFLYFLCVVCLFYSLL